MSILNSVYGFKYDTRSLLDDKEDKLDETAQKDCKTSNRLKREVGNLKRKLRTI